MGGDPYFSHLSSPPPPGLPIFTLHTHSFLKHNIPTINLYSVFSLSIPMGKRGFQMKKIFSVQIIVYFLS